MSNVQAFIGSPVNRVDGRLKVTGAAHYAGEYAAGELLHGAIVSSAIARGTIAAIETEAARSIPGVVEIITHENRPKTAWFDSKYKDEVGPPGSPFRPLYDEKILFSGQPIALVVATSFEAARDAASLIRVSYETQPHRTSLEAARVDAYKPPKKRSGIAAAPSPRGHAEAAFDASAIKLENAYSVATEHHNPMEPFATTVIWEGDEKLRIYDKTQGAQNAQGYVCSVFGLKSDNVRLINAFVGGAFGSGLRPQHQLFLAVLASLMLKRSVRVVLTRDQMFTFVRRPYTLQTVALGADRDGKLQAILHDALAETSQFEDHQEVVVNWSGLLYKCDNVKLTYELAKLDRNTPGDMRAPGATLGIYALESAMDELSYATGIDPIDLRLRNYADIDGNENKPFTSKALRLCFTEGAARFGWSKRNPQPRSMKEGTELIGWGMASAAWEASMMKSAARATLQPSGRLEIAAATADIGTGTYTILAQIAADAMGVAIETIDVVIGDSTLPKSPVQGGSWVAASSGAAVDAACRSLRRKLFDEAKALGNSPFAEASYDDVQFEAGRMSTLNDPTRGISYQEVLSARHLDKIEVEEIVKPDSKIEAQYAAYTHSAIFVEVRVDEELGVVRLTRVVDAVAAGRILNPKTARSQILGGVVMAIGSALHEETLSDHKLGRFMNHNLAEYHVPAHADIADIDVIFVEEPDDKVSPLGVKGLGEIGIVGTAAAIANAIYHATGKRIRDLPITIDKLLD